jgi:hypothetical protein
MGSALNSSEVMNQLLSYTPCGNGYFCIVGNTCDTSFTISYSFSRSLGLVFNASWLGLYGKFLLSQGEFTTDVRHPLSQRGFKTEADKCRQKFLMFFDIHALARLGSLHTNLLSWVTFHEYLRYVPQFVVLNNHSCVNKSLAH